MYQKHLNGGQVNSLVMLTTFFMIMLFNSSCVYVPLPAHDLTSQKGVINDELIESLEPGETTREDLLLLVGAPDTQYEQDRYFIYEWEATESAVVVAGGGGDFIVKAHYFCVEFDEDNRIKRFAHFKSGLFKSKDDVLIEKKLWMHGAETGLFASGPIDNLPAIVDEKRSGEVTVIRIHHPFMFAMKYIISLNGTEIFVIRSGQHTKFKLNEGEHYIGVKCFGGWSSGWKHEFLDFSVTPNSSSFFKVAPNFPCAGIESITEEEALIKIENSKYVPMNKQYVVRSKTRPQVTNQPKEMQKSTSNSETTPTTKATSQSQEAPKLASIPQDAPVVQVSLRKKPLRITEIRIPDMLLEYDFFESSRNTKGSFVNDFVDNNDGTVTDKATGLIWQKSGSSSSLRNRGAKEYIKRLNKERFAGYSDWRLPTVEELASLLARKRESGVYLDPLFDRKKSRCWTVDKFDATDAHLSGAWIVDFKGGQILQATYRKGFGPGAYRKNSENYVKAVSSVK